MQKRITNVDLSIDRSFLAALKSGQVPEKFFYGSQLSINSWLKLCRSKQYRNYARSLRLSERISSRLAVKVRASFLQWISLGSGQGSKELPFLRALRRSKKRVRYYPVDYSEGLLDIAVRSARKLGVMTQGIRADIENGSYWNKIPVCHKPEMRIVSLLGNTLGNFDSRHILSIVGRKLKKDDILIVDGEIFSGKKRVHQQYDNPANRMFAMAPLLSLGISPGDGEFRFDFKRTHRKGIYSLSKSFRFNKSLVIHQGRHEFLFKKGKVLKMSPSYKYDPQGMRHLIESGGYFRIDDFVETNDGRFGLWLARRS